MSSYISYRQSVPKDTNINEFFNISPTTNYRFLKTLPVFEMSSTESTYSTIPSPSQIIDTLNTSNTKMFEFYIGLGLAISSSVFIGSSFIIKKKALKKLAESNTDCRQRASEGGYGYLKEWLWWMGVITMGIGEACNFAAYAFAPASLVTPLGALSVLVTAVLSSRLLDERLNLLGKIGCAVCLLGSTSIVIHSPKEEEVSTMADLAEKMKDPMFIIYVIVIIVVTLGIVIHVAPRYGRSNILVYISVCSLIGSLSVLSVKGLGLAIKETIAGDQQITNFLTWFWLLSVIGCVSVQLIYLNKALDIYNTSMVTPIYYVFFTTFVILASGILYKEWSCLGASDILGNVIGFLTTIIGIFQMQLFRNVDISWRQLHILVHKQAMNGHLDLISSSASLVDYHNDNLNYNSNGKRSYHSPEPLCNIVAPASNNMNVYT
ncbi:Spichthyin [Strongyloides ratti]|uniref:Spichthyin n=1 Tax=Strongyloides ratti TaxID=34506 RepID=A0A090LJU3_STRRB|nr:Spichthyin [Strongyloides ratti]CEF67790.1 Spichthyin [Strongyloides ratti]